MSLNFYTDKVSDEGKAFLDEEANCFAIVHALMFCGMNGITEDNADEFYARVRLVESMVGGFRNKFEDGKVTDVRVTPDEIRKCIGITTNVPTLTRSKFMNGWVKDCVDDWKADYR